MGSTFRRQHRVLFFTQRSQSDLEIIEKGCETMCGFFFLTAKRLQVLPVGAVSRRGSRSEQGRPQDTEYPYRILAKTACFRGKIACFAIVPAENREPLPAAIQRAGRFAVLRGFRGARPMPISGAHAPERQRAITA